MPSKRKRNPTVIWCIRNNDGLMTGFWYSYRLARACIKVNKFRNGFKPIKFVEVV